MARGGAVFLSLDEILELSYSWGIFENSNNIAEALMLWQGLYQAKARNITELNVFRDSQINRQPNNMRLRKIHKKIKLLMKLFHNIKIFHIL